MMKKFNKDNKLIKIFKIMKKKFKKIFKENHLISFRALLLYATIL